MCDFIEVRKVLKKKIAMEVMIDKFFAKDPLHFALKKKLQDFEVEYMVLLTIAGKPYADASISRFSNKQDLTYNILCKLSNVCNDALHLDLVRYELAPTKALQRIAQEDFDTECLEGVTYNEFTDMEIILEIEHGLLADRQETSSVMDLIKT